MEKRGGDLSWIMYGVFKGNRGEKKIFKEKIVFHPWQGIPTKFQLFKFSLKCKHISIFIINYVFTIKLIYEETFLSLLRVHSSSFICVSLRLKRGTCGGSTTTLCQYLQLGRKNILMM